MVGSKIGKEYIISIFSQLDEVIIDYLKVEGTPDVVVGNKKKIIADYKITAFRAGDYVFNLWIHY